MIPAFLLGCDEFPDRKAAALAHFRDRGVPVTFWRSIAGRVWGLETTREYDPGKRLPPGHVGLCLGAWNLWQHLHLTLYRPPLSPEPSALVFEDDAVLPDDWHESFPAVLSELSRRMPDWQLVFLGLAQTEPNVWGNVTERVGGPDSRLCVLNNPFGTHALLLRRSALPVLLDHMAVAERNLDQQLWRRVLSKGLLRWCAVLPSLVKQRTHDHAMTGRPEWSPSTIDPGDVPPVLGVPVVGDTDLPGRPSAATYAATMRAVDPYPCLYRGEFLDDHGRAAGGRTVPLSSCARLNRPCHSRTGAEVRTQENTPVVRCETCPLRKEMAPSPVRNRLPLPDGHFNCSMVVFDGRLVLATRDSWGHSKVALWEMHNESPDWAGRWACRPLGSFASGHPDAPRLEDPRLFVTEDARGQSELHAAFNLPDGYPPKKVNVGYARFDSALSKIEYVHVFRSPRGNLYEKNWVPFVLERALRWVYATKPVHVVLGFGGPFETPNPLPWTGGVIRGGAAPVLMTPLIAHALNYPRVFDGEGREVLYHFFHGCLRRLQGAVYTVGCSVFEAKPPFRVLRQTPTPLVWPDLPAAGEDVVKRYVVFPGGAVPHAGAWHVAAGVDDTFCRIYRLPFAEVEAALSDVPESESAVSIRDTPLATGVTE